MTLYDADEARYVHRRMGEVIAALKTGTKQGQMAQELALIIHCGHKPYGLLGQRVACEDHMNAREEEVSWPCGETVKLAMVLGVELS